MSDLQKARDLILRSVDHLKWARSNDHGWKLEREETTRVLAFYEEVTEFLKTTSPKP
jgi:hypothetical protein